MNLGSICWGKWNCCGLPFESAWEIFVCCIEVIAYHVESKIATSQRGYSVRN